MRSAERRIASFFRQDDIDSVIRSVGSLCGGVEEPAVVGGVLRGLVFEERFGACPTPVDLDIVILRRFNKARMVQGLGEANCVRNTFGGVKWKTPIGFEVDIWSAPSQAALLGRQSHYRLGLPDLLAMLDFNVNAGVYAPAAGTVLIEEILRASERREIDFHNSLVGPAKFQLARILLLELRLQELGFRLSPRVRRWCSDASQNLSPRELATAVAYFLRKSNERKVRASEAYFMARLAELARDEALSREQSTKMHNA